MKNLIERFEYNLSELETTIHNFENKPNAFLHYDYIKRLYRERLRCLKTLHKLYLKRNTEIALQLTFLDSRI